MAVISLIRVESSLCWHISTFEFNVLVVPFKCYICGQNMLSFVYYVSVDSNVSNLSHCCYLAGEKVRTMQTQYLYAFAVE